ncbi:MAG TPA: phosphatase domain-containing protein [Nannocystaceae bacterium]|nr:phosphatase domain-containing protein [Nannocystaceae bacterium]
MSFPIHRANYRTLDPDFAGPVFVADIDRTYLMTRFSTLKGIARIPFERAEHKQDIEGMARLFREIRNGPAEATRDTPLYFVSASPRQLREVIEKKMTLDGIGFDGTTFKDWTRVVQRLRFARLKEQIGFKLTALVTGRAELPTGAEEYLLGDDLEHDPLTYCLYADFLSGRIPAHDVERVLALNGVLPGDAKSIADALRALQPGKGVRAALIRLERHGEPEPFLDYGPGIVPCAGAFQMAIVLWRLGCIARAGIGRVASEMVHRGVEAEAFTQRLRDLVRRAVLDEDDARSIARELTEKEIAVELEDAIDVDPLWLERSKKRIDRVWTPGRFLGE